MTRKWEKLEDGRYTFTLANRIVGEMQISLNSIGQKAICQIGNQNFTIKRTGFWKSTIEILDNDGKILAKTYSEKWYANSSIVEYGNKKYKLILHNNPLAEYRITDGSKTLLAYGLSGDDGKIIVETTGSTESPNVLFDFLLWYLFVPIATENMGDNFIFQLMLSA